MLSLLVAALPLACAKFAFEQRAPAQDSSAVAGCAASSEHEHDERSWWWGNSGGDDGHGDGGDGDGGDGWGGGGWGGGNGGGGGSGGGWGGGSGSGGGWGGSGWGGGWGGQSSSSLSSSSSSTSPSSSSVPARASSSSSATSAAGGPSPVPSSLPGYTLNVDLAQLPSTGVTGNWQLEQTGLSGVSAQQLTIVDDFTALIYDKIEDNPLPYPNQPNASMPAWGAVYDLRTNKPRALTMRTNSFCAGGAWLGNGTYASVGGTLGQYEQLAVNDDGLQSVRMFTPCNGGTTCDVYDNPSQHSLVSPRWYPSTVKMVDGGLLIVGGSSTNSYINNASINVPSVEYWPPKAVAGYQAGETLPLKFLSETLDANLFPISIALPSSQVFMCARENCILYDPTTNSYSTLPGIPNGVKISYPMSATGWLLPLRPSNNYTAEVMICGGSTVADVPKPHLHNISVDDPASSQCQRMVVNEAGIQAGWQLENMHQPRHMHSIINLPNGRAIIVNGAQTGVSSYGGALGNQALGKSNANNPALQGDVYDPWKAVGKRFHQNGVPTSQVPRMYHSSAVITPSGAVMISGSAPHNQAAPVKSDTNPFPTTYIVETLTPPHLSKASGWSVSSLSGRVDYGETFTVTLAEALPTGNFSVAGANVKSTNHTLAVVILDAGYSTHGQQLNARTVQLVIVSVSSDRTTLTVQAPPTHYIYPPGFAWAYVLVDGVWGSGKRIMIGPGTVGELPLKNDRTETTSQGPGWIPQTNIQHGDPLRAVAAAAGDAVSEAAGAAGKLLDEVAGNTTQH